MIKLLVFDLDNTLFDTHGQLGVKVIDEMLYRMRKAGLRSQDEKVIRKKYSFTGFRVLARELKLSEKLQNIGMGVYKEMDLSGITPFSDLEVLGSLGLKKALVTSGTQVVQMEKIRVLGIQKYFDEIIVDESNSVDGRKNIFSELAAKYRAKPDQVIVIGDNPEIELAAGKTLGMITVQIIRRENILRGEADYHVNDLHEFKKILEGAEK